MKHILVTLCFLFCAGTGTAQDVLYTLPHPDKWGTEKISFPINFAQSIPFKGNEEIRFTPGWGDSKSEEYWSYVFLWFVEGAPAINADNLKQYLTQYYNGLYLTNQKEKTPVNGGFTKIEIKKTTAASGDDETYLGKIATLNFLTKTAFSLNARIHIRRDAVGNHTAVLLEISPRDYKHAVWDSMDKIVAGFEFNTN